MSTAEMKALKLESANSNTNSFANGGKIAYQKNNNNKEYRLS